MKRGEIKLSGIDIILAYADDTVLVQNLRDEVIHYPATVEIERDDESRGKPTKKQAYEYIANVYKRIRSKGS